jgi:hypothetical protein
MRKKLLNTSDPDIFCMKLNTLSILHVWTDHPVYIELIIEFEQFVVVAVELSFMHKIRVLGTGATHLDKMKYCY